MELEVHGHPIFRCPECDFLVRVADDGRPHPDAIIEHDTAVFDNVCSNTQDFVETRITLVGDAGTYRVVRDAA